MIQRRVSITGIGPVTPAGTGHDAFLRGIFKNSSREPAGRLAAQRGVKAGLVKDFRIGAYAVDAVYLDSPRHVQFAMAATALALRDAGLALADVRGRRPLVAVARAASETGGVLGAVNGSACVGTAREGVARWVGAGKPADAVPEFTSGLAAVGYAAEQISCGNAELAICGGADVSFHPGILDEMYSLGLASETGREGAGRCRPFDLWRKTGLAGEGGCIFVLEPESGHRHALATVAGFGMAVESGSAPWSSFGEAARLALGNARLRPKDVDAICADGKGQKSLDRFEAAALKSFFGAQLHELPAAAIQGVVGNALSGAGAVQLGCAALGMKHSLIAPTFNWQHPDPACPLKLCQTVRQYESRATLVSSRDAHGEVVCLLLTP